MASRPPAAPATLVPDTPPPAAIASSTAYERIPRVREQSLEPEPPPSAAKPAPVRAFLRLRPSLHPAAPRVVHRLSNHPEKVSLARSPSHSDPVYTFNDVFDEDASQDDVFRAAALPLLTRLFDRKTPQNTTSAYTGDAGGDSTPLNDAASDELIMAYGPSGSGKTFSLNSILAKAVDFLVRKISPAEGDNNTNFPVVNIKPLRWNEVQYSAAPGEASFSKSSASGFHTLWISFVEILKDLTEIQIVNVKQAMDLISQVHELRRTAETKVNRASSRSHLITTLKLLKFTNSSNTPQISRIAIADLAGSENAKQTGAGGDLLDEAITINLSLHYLSECVKGMVKSQKTGTCNLKSKTAFRNCQLTQFLYPYFRSGLVTFLFHVNPANEEQTKAVLDFSQQSCRLMTYIPSSNNGKQPNRTRSQPAEKPASGEITRLKAEVERLRVLEKQHSAAQQRVRQLEDIAADFRAQWRNLLDTTHLEEKRRKDEYLRMLTNSEIHLREATLQSERDVSEKLEKKLEVAEMLSAGKICELQRELEQKETESQELQEQLLSEMATMEEKLQEFIEKAESDRKLISQLNARIEELQNSANCSTNTIEDRFSSLLSSVHHSHSENSTQTDSMESLLTGIQTVPFDTVSASTQTSSPSSAEAQTWTSPKGSSQLSDSRLRLRKSRSGHDNRSVSSPGAVSSVAPINIKVAEIIDASKENRAANDCGTVDGNVRGGGKNNSTVLAAPDAAAGCGGRRTRGMIAALQAAGWQNQSQSAVAGNIDVSRLLAPTSSSSSSSSMVPEAFEGFQADNCSLSRNDSSPATNKETGGDFEAVPLEKKRRRLRSVVTTVPVEDSPVVVKSKRRRMARK
ncbi:hypothetical protein HDU84_003438 [Entophlyctis sp. JEL0112]|nr:hypothetical protein HDU84_003438 [Entophlyctis sp. JEL0112]